jgi:methyl-galactoside transport system ATP-binding protein
MPSPFALEMQHVSKAFPGVQALDDVSFQLRPGTVHALMGENGAGKSTLMKCLFGIYSPDRGDIRLHGTPVNIGSSKHALALGISMIHQELLPVRQRSVMENVWLGRYPQRRFGPLRLVDHGAMFDRTRQILADLHLDLDPRRRVSDMSTSQIQSMEIAKAVSQAATIVIMDEPTSSLTQHEADRLFETIDRITQQGVSIIYISHKMEEILKIADDVTIMRDGRVVGTHAASELTTQMIISKMVGRDLSQRFPRRVSAAGATSLRVEGLTSAEPHSFTDVSFELSRGEILGIGGLVGAQRTELVEAIFGLRPLAAGRIHVNGVHVNIDSPRTAKRHRLALVTEERRATGVFPVLSVADNTLIANLRRYRRATLLLDGRRAGEDVERVRRRLDVKTPSVATPIQNLSGGNQQKVILARWLLTDPDVLILDEPTRGIDVGAKFEIYSIVAGLAERGTSILWISSEMPELLGMSDRVLVMCEGRVTGTLDAKVASQEQIMRLATQFEPTP